MITKEPRLLWFSKARGKVDAVAFYVSKRYLSEIGAQTCRIRVRGKGGTQGSPLTENPGHSVRAISHGTY